MKNKIGDLIYYKKPIEKSHNQQTKNILCEIINIKRNLVVLKSINIEDEIDEEEILNNEFKFRTEKVWTDVEHIKSAGFILKSNYLQLNNIYIFKPGCNSKKITRNFEENTLNSLGVFLVTKDLITPFNCNDYWINGHFDYNKFNKNYKELTYLNDFIDFLKSEKIEFNLKEMLTN